MPKSQKSIRFTVSGQKGQTRLDNVLRNQYPLWGRRAIAKIINNRQVRVSGKTVWLGSWKVKNGDKIVIFDPPENKPEAPAAFEPSWVVADQGDLIVVNKPAGLRSQAARAGDDENLLTLAQEYYSADIHLFHRLDRDTSGLCLLTRPGPVNAYLDEVFKSQQAEKEYLALVGQTGQLEDEGVLRSYLARHEHRSDMMQVVEKGGQYAQTAYRLEGQAKGGWLVRLWPKTGRTHQLRVQLASLQAPIRGDRLYGGAKAKRLMLHARRLALPELDGFPPRAWEAEAEF